MRPPAGAAWHWLPLAVWASCLLPAVAGAAPPAQPTDARGWIERMQSAAKAGNYQGVLVFSAGASITSSRVSHFVTGDQVFERVEALDGRQQRVLRHNELVHTVLPQTRTAVIETRVLISAAYAVPQMVEPQALESYEFRPEGASRVAGREVQVFLLEPKDLLRYAQRLWADQGSGLMLRAEVLGLLAAGAPGPRPVIESTAFSEVAIGQRSQADGVLQEIAKLRRLEGYRVVTPEQRRTTLAGEGWELVRPVAGFTLAGCIRRSMGGNGANGDAQPVMQAMFSDGLTSVSLFVEPHRDAQRRSAMQSQQGATSQLVTRRGDYWITAVGDVPPATLKLFADAIERRKP